MWLDAGKALQVVDRGPSPSNAAESKAWKALWGDHSETRRFKDGSIIHAVVWDVPNALRHTSVLLAARALLGRHIGIAPCAHANQAQTAMARMHAGLPLSCRFAVCAS